MNEETVQNFRRQRMSGHRIVESAAGVRQTATSLCGNTPGFPSRPVLGCSERGHGQGWVEGQMEVGAPSGGHWQQFQAVVRCTLCTTRHLHHVGRWNSCQGRKFPNVMSCLNYR